MFDKEFDSSFMISKNAFFVFLHIQNIKNFVIDIWSKIHVHKEYEMKNIII